MKQSTISTLCSFYIILSASEQLLFIHLYNEQNVLVNENFVHLLEMTCQEHPGLEVQYGGVGGFIAKKPPKRVDPMKVIQVCWVK